MKPIDIPKVELHIHADCSLSARALRALAMGATDQAGSAEFSPPESMSDLPTFLLYAKGMVDLLQSPDSLRLMVDDTVDQLAADNVVYSEIRFAPHQHLVNGLTPDEVVDIVDGQVSAAQERTGVETRLILCSLMHFSPDVSTDVVRLIARRDWRNVVAFDIAGDGVNFSFGPHEDACRLANAEGIPMTLHAGESAGPDSVAAALNLGALRIGHGIRSIEDADVLRRVIGEQIHLEVCPRNNVQTGNVSSIADHPVTELLRRGASLGISSDAKTLTGSLNDEYEALTTEAGWTVGELQRANLMAIEAAFTDDATKRTVIEALQCGTLPDGS